GPAGRAAGSLPAGRRSRTPVVADRAAACRAQLAHPSGTGLVMSHDHDHPTADTDARWLIASLGVLAAFMVGEVIAGLLAHSLALISDAGHLLTDVAALVVALIAGRIARRPARGS